MKNRDLQFIIKDMAARLDSHQPDEVPVRPGMLSEVEAYMAVDPALARLHKEFMDARRTRRRALEQQGDMSAMADIARDLEDSAQSAMETRMIELRADAIKRMMVERMMAQAHIQEMDDYREEARQTRIARESVYHEEERAMRVTASRRTQEGEDSFLMLLLMWWMMRQMVWRTQVKLSLASSFSRAMAPDYTVRAA